MMQPGFWSPVRLSLGGCIGIQRHRLYPRPGIGRLDERANFSGETGIGNFMDVAVGVAAVRGGIWTLASLGAEQLAGAGDGMGVFPTGGLHLVGSCDCRHRGCFSVGIP